MASQGFQTIARRYFQVLQTGCGPQQPEFVEGPVLDIRWQSSGNFSLEYPGRCLVAKALYHGNDSTCYVMSQSGTTDQHQAAAKGLGAAQALL